MEWSLELGYSKRIHQTDEQFVSPQTVISP